MLTDQKIYKNLVKRFRNNRIDFLLESAEQNIIELESKPELMNMIMETLIPIGDITTQKVKIRILENMEDDELYEFIEEPLKLKYKLNNLIKLIKNPNISVNQLERLICYLNMDVEIIKY